MTIEEQPIVNIKDPPVAESMLMAPGKQLCWNRSIFLKKTLVPLVF
jgi:hypothetical protein